ncbi:hypothetical protein D9613_011550 [Agrocybe pediades]|uniref:Alpha/beta hydrolase fold-3 domain-containing protein n=1 Tax=Agrocybe pediades TaxID=84607 RepID=A0A8H4QWP8_9AGAR|nr:hypothetical protein D9613_011550 [Agrocybe pediades]
MASTTNMNGNVSFLGKLWIFLTFLRFPPVLLYNLTLTRSSERNKNKSVARVIGDSATRWVTGHLDAIQVQHYFGTSPKTYKAFLKETKMPEITDELEGGGRLLWVGPKEVDRVLLYCHGGGFVTCLADFHLHYCLHLKNELESRLDGKRVGVAVLEYSLAPDFPFPTQLKQLVAAVNLLFSNGVKPENLHLIGDSAGANLVVQLLSHTLHPLPSVPASPLQGSQSKLGGVYLMSPWASLLGDFPSAKVNANTEWVTQDLSISMGKMVLARVPEEQRAYLEIAKAPKDWFNGVNQLVNRVLVTLGEKECLSDPIIILIEALKQYHPSVQVAIEPHGVHNDILQDFFVKEKKLNTIARAVDDWLEAGYKASVV